MTEEPKGTFRAYGERKQLRQATLDMIHAANHVLAEYGTMTLRQLYYQFVARGFTGGVNTVAMYEKLGTAINIGRMQGLVSWTAIEDWERDLMGFRTHSSPESALTAARNQYKRDLWADQPWRPEVWVEKKAQLGTISAICNELRVNYFACKGYNSQSEQWRAGQRFAGYIRKGQRPIVFHLGDHDPSGIDMTRDNQERLSLFAGVPIIVQRLALNMPQIEEFNPPPNPAKLSDSRATAYIEEYGHSSWELDALEPNYIKQLVREAVLRIRDEDTWNESLRRENMDLAEMDLMIEHMRDDE